MKLERVPLQYVHVVWPDVAPMLAKALPYAQGEVTLDHMQAYAADGTWELFVVTNGATVHGAVLVQFFNRPTMRVAFIQAVGGRGIIAQDTFDQLKAYAARQGATVIECGARPAMTRLLNRIGLREKYRVLGLRL